MRKWIVALILALVALIPIVYFTFFWTQVEVETPAVAIIEFVPQTPIKLQAGLEVKVKACRILDGYLFDFLLENNEWIRTQLPSASKDEATAFVVELFKKSDKMKTPPTVVLLRPVGDYWIVELNFDYDGKRVGLRDVLKEKNLVF